MPAASATTVNPQSACHVIRDTSRENSLHITDSFTHGGAMLNVVQV